MTRLLCTGDLHLGKGAQYADDRLSEQEAVWARILELADEHDVGAVLFAGDAFEGPIPTPEHYDAFIGALAASELPVIAVTGNGRHDAAMRETSALEVTDSAGGLQVSRRPELIELRDCTVATLPWTPITRKVAAANGGDRDDVNAEAALQLLAVAQDLYDRAPSDRPVVLLGHWTLSGWSTPTGMDTSLLRDVVLPSDELGDIGFDACVFGHIHKGGVVLGDIDPVFYVGSPMPLDFGEASCDHGCWLLTVGDDEPEDLLFLPIESRPFVTLDVGPLGDAYEDALAALDFRDEPIVKMRYTATAEEARRIDNSAIRRALLDAGASRVYIEPTIIREQRARVAGLDESIGDDEALGMWIEGQEIEPGLAARLRDRHTAYAEALA